MEKESRVAREQRERDAEEVSQLLNKAWYTLRDPTRRSMYDSGRVLFGATSIFASFTGGEGGLLHSSRSLIHSLAPYYVSRNTSRGRHFEELNKKKNTQSL